MVKKLRLAGMTIVTLLALGACQVLFIGVFSPLAGQMAARADLSEIVPAAPAGSFELTRVTAGGSEYFILSSNLGFDPAQVHIVVMDKSLNVLNTYTNNALPSPLGWSHAMTDAAGRVLIGQFSFAAQPGGLVSPVPSLVAISSPSVTGLPAYPRNEANFNAAGGFLAWNEYTSAWATTGINPSVPLGRSSLYLSRVFTEWDSGGMPDVFVLRENNGSTTYFLLIPKSLVDGNNLLAYAVPDVFTKFGSLGLIVQKSDLDDTVAVAYGDVLAYDHHSNLLIHFALGDPDKVSGLPMKWSAGMKLAAGATGYLVVWDPVARAVTRYEPWW